MTDFQPHLIEDFDISAIRIDRTLDAHQPVASATLCFKNGRSQCFRSAAQSDMPEAVIHFLYQEMPSDHFDALSLDISQNVIQSPIGSYILDCLSTRNPETAGRLHKLQAMKLNRRKERFLRFLGSDYIPHTI